MKESVEGYEQKLALFNIPDTETGIMETNVREYRPQSQINGSSVIEFNIPNNGSEYMMLKDAKLFLELEILDHRGTPVQGEEIIVGPIQMPLNSIFRQMDISLQQKVITTSVGSHYGYKTVIDALLNRGRGAQKGPLSTHGFLKDTPTVMDGTPEEEWNMGAYGRSRMFKTGKSVVSGRLFMDISEMDKCLINGVPVSIKLFQATDDFRLSYNVNPPATEEGEAGSRSKRSASDTPAQAGKQGGTQSSSQPQPPATAARKAEPRRFSLNITDAVMKIPFVKIHPALLLAHANTLEEKPAIYPFGRSDLKSFNVPKGSLHWGTENLFQNAIPKRLVVCMVASEAFSGKPELNPFHFKHYSLTSLAFEVDGQSYPHRPFETDFDEGRFDECYSAIFDGVPDSQRELPNITKDDFVSGYAFFVINIEGKHLEGLSKPRKTGNTRLSLKFAEPLPESVTVIAYGTFESVVSVDKARNVNVLE